jgi:hypothetical protein
VQHHEIVVACKRHRERRRRERGLRQVLAHRRGRRHEDVVQLLPAVRLFQPGEAVEVEIQNEQLAALYYLLSGLLQSRSECRNSSPRIA